jgi:hypothetical protein
MQISGIRSDLHREQQGREPLVDAVILLTLARIMILYPMQRVAQA